jgi:hypothetical protein
MLQCVVQMRNAIVKTTKHLVFAHPALKQIPHQIKAAFECHQFAQTQRRAQRVTCASLENAIYLALIQVLALSEKDASIMFAQRFATQITIVCLEKFVMKEFVFLAVLLMSIVHTLKYA